MSRGKGDHYLTGGHYGVVPWEGTSFAVSASACHDNGHWSVADPRPMPGRPADKLVARIRALDGTWHRPFTTLELAALQSLLDPEDSWVPWRLDGESDQAWRERIGNAVPSDAAEAIAEVMGETLLLAMAGRDVPAVVAAGVGAAAADRTDGQEPLMYARTEITRDTRDTPIAMFAASAARSCARVCLSSMLKPSMSRIWRRTLQRYHLARSRCHAPGKSPLRRPKSNASASPHGLPSWNPSCMSTESSSFMVRLPEGPILQDAS
jgi:hypothetical protein